MIAQAATPGLAFEVKPAGWAICFKVCEASQTGDEQKKIK